MGEEMRVYLFISQTGGVGKSTIAWALAWRIAAEKKGARVLFIDQTKAQGTRSMRVAPRHEAEGRGLGKALNAVFSVILAKVPFAQQWDEIEAGLKRARQIILDSVVKVYSDAKLTHSLDVLPAASARLSAVIQERWTEPEPGTIMGKVLESLEDRYDYCVIDVTPDIECKSVRSAMTIADAVLSIQSVKSEDTIQGIAQLLGAVEDTHATFAGFIANMHNPRRKESNTALKVLEDACEETGLPLLSIIADKASISNTTRVYHQPDRDTPDHKVISGLYAEIDQDPSSRKSLIAFGLELDKFLTALEGASKRNEVVA
jgi:cellulose biosynthesis protein BcsQ